MDLSNNTDKRFKTKKFTYKDYLLEFVKLIVASKFLLSELCGPWEIISAKEQEFLLVE